MSRPLPRLVVPVRRPRAFAPLESERGETVGNADTLDGQHAAAFALVGHDHDDRYLRRSYSTSERFNAGESKVITSLADAPDIVTFSYNYPDTDTGLPLATTYVMGALTPDGHRMPAGIADVASRPGVVNSAEMAGPGWQAPRHGARARR